MVIRGQLTTGELLKPGSSSKTSFTVIGYGPEVERIRRNLDFLSSNINRDVSIEVAWDCEINIK